MSSSMRNASNTNEELKRAKAIVQTVINQLTQLSLQNQLINNTFKQSTSILFQIGMPALPAIKYLETTSDIEGQELAKRVRALMTGSLNTVSEIRNTHAQPEGQDIKALLIQQSQINDPFKLQSFLHKHIDAFAEIGGIEAYHLALRNAAGAGCHLNLSVLLDMGASSLARAPKSNSLAIHQAIDKLKPDCVKVLLDSLESHGGFYCDLEQIFAEKNNKNSLALIIEKDFAKLSKNQQENYLAIVRYIQNHLHKPKQSTISAEENIKRIALIQEILIHLEACIEIMATDLGSKMDAKQDDEIKMPALKISAPLPLAIPSVISYRYKPEEKQEIIAKLEALTGCQHWNMSNHFDGTLVLTHHISDRNLCAQVVTALNQSKAMEATLIEHSERELKHSPGKLPYSIRLGKLHLPKIRELQALEGIDLQPAEQPGAKQKLG